ncbi:conserved phage C-terminal domain-containing protein [Heyndrickxia oleronia]|uniref:conserved phage C-terminal domain-containing protein n=1 Tax=Heyndrickxia oleronia TaxID=38875 RepID=UPI001C0EBC5A|nr:conserved phage C-terminal domain-containing protein [Heyndrickxia oleronia]MBU5214508.1 conserved phage C-terminal domain-containing protein [Heyndrickxia oleronia]
MAKFRMVHTEFWDDPKVVEEMTPEDKFFFLYLLTNSNTTQIGIYQITKKQMAFDMGYSLESVNALLERFINHHKIVRYSAESRELALKNWGRYNFNKGGKPIIDCVQSELKTVKDISLIQYVGERIEKKDIKKLYESYYESPAIRGQEEEKEKEEEKEEEKEYIPFDEVVSYLNLKTNSSYRTTSKKTQNLIKARWNEGFKLEDFKNVIDKKSTEWLNDPKMNKFLRPETLFGTKFESYLNQKGGGSNRKANNTAQIAEEYDLPF